MRRRKRPQTEEQPIDLTPMLDVVFILLIFFIVTASFVRETGVEFARPRAVTSASQERARILVGIDANDNIWIDRRRLPLQAVRAQVERMRAENPNSAAVIQADVKASSGLLVRVMDQIRLAGVEQVAVSAHKP
ncbi:MAG: biopolymer transporter ExbD [Gammaproteobacteria bacterium SHHR-1]|uniref:ExbD/TolR family protein n=1 Tax=Magnetovirga frankeli TaxID=947516 RepID=UPI0012935BA2|nr:biopolymer transporter ExbD [gamma proteobacterium SS-5]